MEKINIYKWLNGSFSFCPKWLKFWFVTILVPVYSFSISTLNGYALARQSIILKKAYVTKARGEVLIKMGEERSQPIDDRGRTPQGASATLQDWNDQLVVAGDNNSEAFLSSIPYSLQAYASPQPTQTIYKFPCSITSGSLIVGWQKGKRRGCAPPGLELRIATPKNQSQWLSAHRILVPESPVVAAISPIKVYRKFLNAQYYLEQLRYCTVAASGQGWWLRWGQWSNPCLEAAQECSHSISDGECIVVSLGEWSVNEASMIVSVECADNRVFTAKGNGLDASMILIRDLALEALNKKATSCALNIYQPDKLIVSPASEKATLIQTGKIDGSLWIDALAGDVIIRSAQKIEGQILRFGNRYIYPENKIQPINVSDAIRSTSVQAFLNTSNWPIEVASKNSDYADQSASEPTSEKDSTQEALTILWEIWNILPKRQPSQKPSSEQDSYSNPK